MYMKEYILCKYFDESITNGKSIAINDKIKKKSFRKFGLNYGIRHFGSF